MKRHIVIQDGEIENPASGDPFTQANPKYDPTPEQRAAREPDDSGNSPEIALTTGLAIRVFLGLYTRAAEVTPSLEECSNATEIFLALRAAEGGDISIGTHAYDWLVETFRKHGPKVFSINAGVILDAFRLLRVVTKLPHRGEEVAVSA